MNFPLLHCQLPGPVESPALTDVRPGRSLFKDFASDSRDMAPSPVS